jgi:hypothetical protein
VAIPWLLWVFRVDQNLGQAFEFSIEAWIDSPIIARIRFRPGT